MSFILNLEGTLCISEYTLIIRFLKRLRIVELYLHLSLGPTPCD